MDSTPTPEETPMPTNERSEANDAGALIAALRAQVEMLEARVEMGVADVKRHRARITDLKLLLQDTVGVFRDIGQGLLSAVTTAEALAEELFGEPDGVPRRLNVGLVGATLPRDLRRAEDKFRRQTYAPGDMLGGLKPTADPALRLVGPPHAHIDGPCGPTCYEPEPDTEAKPSNPGLDPTEYFKGRGA